MNVHFFESITFPAPKVSIYRRLGYAQGITKLKSQQQDKVEQSIAKALTLIDLKGAAVRLSIEKIQSPKIQLSEGLIFKSQSLSELLKDCEEVFLMAACAGKRIIEQIQKDSSGLDVSAAAIYDATASEVVDEALSWIMNFMGHELRRENKRLTDKRFSAGYGDFGLENQEIFYDKLDLKRLGMSLAKNYILSPEKSVTAVAGIQAVS